MIHLFKHSAHQQTFEQEGYIVLPLLNPGHIKALRNRYVELGLTDPNAYDINKERVRYSPDMVRGIRDFIWEIILPELDTFFFNYRPVFAEYLPKDPNPASIIPMHQDWAFVEEDKGFSSVSLWVALEDITIENGAMGILRGTHRISEILTPPSPSPMAPLPLINHVFTAFAYIKPVIMKAGEVLVFDNRTFHGSLPNLSSQSRLVARLSITQKGGQLSHFYLKPDGTRSTIIQYSVDEDFPVRYTNEILSDLYRKGEVIKDYPMVQEKPYTFPSYGPEELVNVLKDLGNEFNSDVCNILEPIFGPEMRKENIYAKAIQNKNAHDEEFSNESALMNIFLKIKKKLKIGKI